MKLVVTKVVVQGLSDHANTEENISTSSDWSGGRVRRLCPWRGSRVQLENVRALSGVGVDLTVEWLS